MSKVCSRCKLDKPLEDYFKGNASFGKKSECKICQNLRRIEYRKKPGIRARELSQDKARYKNLSQDRKHEIYLRRKDEVKEWCKVNRARLTEQKRNYSHANKERLDYMRSEWRKANWEKYQAIRKASKATRRLKEKEGGRLCLSSVVALQEYNHSTFNPSSFTCEYCRNSLGDDYDLEHITPLSRGGSNKLENLAISCFKCNHDKFTKTLEEFKPELKTYFETRKII